MLYRCMLKAYCQGFIGDRIQWIIRGYFEMNWWTENDTKCTPDQIKRAMGYYFSVLVSVENERTKPKYGLVS